MARSQMQMAQTRRLYNYGLPLLRHKQCFGCCWQYLKSKLLIIKIFLHSYLGIDTVFSLHGYELSLSELVSTTTLVLGLCSLIVGEVFAIGLKMKEEQDLTI